MNRKSDAGLGVLLLVALFSGGPLACSDAHHTEAAAPETILDVPLVTAQKTVAPDWLEVVGTLRATQTSQVSSQMMGRIIEIRAHEGDRVQSGQVLATIDDAQPRAAVDQATAAVAAADKEVVAANSEFGLAQSTLKRYQQLYDKKSVSPQEFDEIQTRYQSAEARRDMAQASLAEAKATLAQAQTALGYTEIRAPFPGIITEKKADAGTLASPGMPIFTLEDARKFRLEVMVDEGEIRFVREGMTAMVMIDALGPAPLTGKVVNIVPAADPSSRSFLVKVELPSNDRLRSGLFGTARFRRGERTVVLLPRAAVINRGQLQGVYALDSHQVAELRYVTLGQGTGDMVEILSGLQGGETVIAAPGDKELGGKRIAPRP